MKRVVAAVLLVLSACSTSPDSEARVPAGASDPSTGASPSLATVDGGASRGAAMERTPPPASSTATATAGVSPGSSASTSSVAASVAKACLQRGETQTMTVVGLKSREVVGFSTQYSDGSNELTNNEYTSGYGSGPAGNDGRYTTTWVVPRQAPAGRAEVLVIWGSGKEPLRVSFMIPAGGAC